ncbi:hypothetical protein Agabi119p4_2804 [Agaricus bisporus var. burnettii]|uniref:PWWP domain-containing protein n=1 Tax=Agaricus bisporus var. burnettii TaxID=192524 RepID=A0A8H7F605_AGABI|nr:hypothetical protein Agabi119p4_2804 [Agaricus bisporus var. burnettii]
MNIVQPSKRRAAIKAATRLVDISSDEDDKHDTTVAHHVKGSKSKRGKGKSSGSRRHTIGGSEELGVAAYVAKRKKRQNSVTLAGSPRKRLRGSDQDRSIEHVVRNDDEISDLTPLSSGDEQERRQRSFTRPLAEFPLQFSQPSSNAASCRETSRKSPLPIMELDDDSDDLPDVEMVLSQQPTTLSKGPNSWTQYTPAQERPQSRSGIGIPHLLTSSPIASPKFPSSTFASSSHSRSLVDGETATEMDLSDFSGDSDLEMNSVAVGELCLAKAKGTDTMYWPAKVIQTKKRKSGRAQLEQKIYRVLFLDRKEKDIPRSWFYVDSEDEFGTCPVGKFQSSHIEVINDFDEESRKDRAIDSRRQRPALPSRAPSPVTIPSPPLSGLLYHNLSLRQQFEYVKPILKAIMNEEYTWGLRRHELYVSGEASRQKLKNEAGLRGAVDARSVDEFLSLVELWCLGCRGRDFDEGEERTKESQQLNVPILNGDKVDDAQKVVGSIPEVVPEEIHIQADTLNTGPEPQITPMEIVRTEEPSSSKFKHSSGEEPIDSRPETPPPPSPFISFAKVIPLPEARAPLPREKRPRQHGSASYENLSPLEKVQYCLEVLLPETFKQVLLWRTGERKSVEVMWDDVEEEKRLHERGERLLKETDWVMDVMRLRRAVEGAKGKKASTAAEIGAKNKSKHLRRTRSGRVGNTVGSYRE